MHYTISPRDMQRIEKAAFAQGVPSLLLMEHAAEAVIEVLRRYPAKHVLFAAGSGNNGGDALAAARLYAGHGEAVVWLPMGCKTPDAQSNLAYLRRLPQVKIIEDSALPADLAFDAAVDGLLGTGLRGAPDAAAAAAIKAVNGLNVPVIAIDVPSGMDALTGAVYEDICIRAQSTVTFHRVKTGLYITRRRAYVGEVIIADIGLPGICDDAEGCQVADPCDLPAFLPPRTRDMHKGACGRVVLYAGSMGMSGAAAMAGHAALRAGAGLATVICPREVMPILQTQLPNAMCVDRSRLPGYVPLHDAYVFGCGIIEDEEAWQHILSLHDPLIPAVWDAGALNLLSRHPMNVGKNTVLTPHAAEAARLLGCELAQILIDPIAAAKAIACKYGCGTVALKGATTVITDGERVALNVVGTSALAKGGSGDALAGILGALLAGGKTPFEAAQGACLWHGMAGLYAEKELGGRSVLTGDVADALGKCLTETERP
ncbi:MAG: NAD(P)H-hydrate dehydratase [Clostridia bacterium]|nr:NAD(P)H-hydrate dehydratase [Clostridia bacterium]